MATGLFLIECTEHCEELLIAFYALIAHQPFTLNFISVLLFTFRLFIFRIFSTTSELVWGLIFVEQPQYLGLNVFRYRLI